MNTSFKTFILQKLNAKALHEVQMVQQLWSGYGSIKRYRVLDGFANTIIVKHVKLPELNKHPRGWNTDISHQRKVNSYEVESNWYDSYSKQSDDTCRIPACYGILKIGTEVCIVLEDLDASGYPLRKTMVTKKEADNCIKWLANFHASYLNIKPTGLWETGTYWHLETRPDELKVLDDVRLKNAAHEIDSLLASSPFQTIVHGDAKLANFCFTELGGVAAVDFQYVGGGVGVKDLAYFIGSCYDEEDCETLEEDILNVYFSALQKGLEKRNIEIKFSELEKDWRNLYPVAWTDFHRFLKGWSPGHWKINSYSEKISKSVLDQIGF